MMNVELVKTGKSGCSESKTTTSFSFSSFTLIYIYPLLGNRSAPASFIICIRFPAALETGANCSFTPGKC